MDKCLTPDRTSFVNYESSVSRFQSHHFNVAPSSISAELISVSELFSLADEIQELVDELVMLEDYDPSDTDSVRKSSLISLDTWDSHQQYTLDNLHGDRHTAARQSSCYTVTPSTPIVPCYCNITDFKRPITLSHLLVWLFSVSSLYSLYSANQCSHISLLRLSVSSMTVRVSLFVCTFTCLLSFFCMLLRVTRLHETTLTFNFSLLYVCIFLTWAVLHSISAGFLINLLTHNATELRNTITQTWLMLATLFNCTNLFLSFLSAVLWMSKWRYSHVEEYLRPFHYNLNRGNPNLRNKMFSMRNILVRKSLFSTISELQHTISLTHNCKNAVQPDGQVGQHKAVSSCKIGYETKDKCNHTFNLHRERHTNNSSAHLQSLNPYIHYYIKNGLYHTLPDHVRMAMTSQSRDT